MALCAVIAGSLPAANNYLVHSLVADLPSQADRVDVNLVNPWGIAASPTGPFWVGNNHTGTSTVYDTSGAPHSLIVSIPSDSPTTPGAVTGVIFNGGSSFPVATGAAAVFLFCTEDGTIAGWNASVDANNARILLDESASHAVYKGCALGGTTDAPLLYAADFRNGKIAVWDANFQAVASPAGSFQDGQVPGGFAPFNIQNIGGKLYVTYARQDAEKQDDVAGLGNGYISVFDMSGTLLAHLSSQGPLNSPWGMVIAPTGFGDFGGALLVGNFGDGKIHAFSPTDGTLLGTLDDVNGNAVVIPGLWALLFGNGAAGGDRATLYFTAGSPGPNGEAVESHGAFGSIQAAPSFPNNGLANGASFSTTLAPNSWGTIIGGGLSATTRAWLSSDFVNNQLPSQLNGVSVTINGEPAYVSYISPTQINFLIPSDLAPGPIQVATQNNGLLSGAVDATLSPAAPSFFLLSGNYIAATHADGSLTGPPALISGLTTTPVVPGETVVLYGNGFGATNPAVTNGQLVTTPLNLSALPTLTIGGLPATVTFAGLSATGLYQINAIVPAVPAGAGPQTDAVVIAEISGMQSPSTSLLSVAAPVVTPAAVSISNFAFVPTPITVAQGSPITWTNSDGVQHTVTADDGSFGSLKLNKGDTFSQALQTPGTYNYHCSIHASMHGTIVVK